MEILLSTTQELAVNQYNKYLFTGSISCLIAFLISLIRFNMDVKQAAMVTCTIFALYYYYANSWLGGFHLIEQTGSVLTFKYASPIEDKLVVTNEILYITSDFHVNAFSRIGSSPGCFITFHLNTGQNMESTVINDKNYTCRDKAKEMEQVLGL